ncbi:MAG: N-acetylneuraminate synthase [Flavobacteriales bacterium]|nr:N-acetylneuraminate synthase [Flavobacteriales bacterium]
MPNKVIIIAEAGVNHNGSIELAKDLIDVAAQSGADYVKFQTFKAEKLVSRSANLADYQKNNLKQTNQTQFEMLSKLELNESAHHELIAYCKKQGVKFLSTGFDIGSLEMLNLLGIDIFKVPSGEITNLPYIEKLISFRKPIILSTGMCTLQEVRNTFRIITESGVSVDQITILHCNTEYPTPFKDVNLKAMSSIQKEFGVQVGYSDHTLGIEVPIAAVAMGAVCIEKHFTLDRSMDGPDHKASLEPDELKSMVCAIRNIEQALGDGIKRPSESEQKNINIARKSIHINKELKEGHLLSAEDFDMMRPGDGLSPMSYKELVGRKIKRDLSINHQLKLADLR